MDLSFSSLRRESAAADSDELEPLGWATLSARLSATHRLRRELSESASRHRRCGTASFAPAAFGAEPFHDGSDPALSRDSFASTHPRDDVNLEPLGDGKSGEVIGSETGGTHSNRDCWTRGMQ